MKTLLKWGVVASVGAAVAAAPAAANPVPEPGPGVIAYVAPIAIIGGLAGGFITYALYKRYVATRPSFAGEEVTIKLEPDRARVTGVYRFYNPGDKPRTLKLRYPFARGLGLGEPENVVVRDGDGGDIPFSWKRHDVAFEVTIPPQSEAVVSVAYEQACTRGEFTYVLTSTRNWQRPIGDASFAVEAPRQFAPVKGSYKLEKVPGREGVARYELRREDFYPDVDLVLRWERPDFYFGSTALDTRSEAPPPASGE